MNKVNQEETLQRNIESKKTGVFVQKNLFNNNKGKGKSVDIEEKMHLDRRQMMLDFFNGLIVCRGYSGALNIFKIISRINVYI